MRGVRSALAPACALAGACMALIAGTAASAAPAAAAARPRSCGSILLGGLLDSRTPVALTQAPAASLLESFAVLRRALSSGDALPPLNPLGSLLDYELGSYFPGEVRQAAVLPDGARVMVVLGYRFTSPVPPARCLPRSLRAHRRALVEAERRRAQEALYCVAEIDTEGGRGEGESDCQSLAGIYGGAGLQQAPAARDPKAALVPDGVARVKIAYREGTTVEASVGENVFLFAPPHREADRLRAFLRRPLAPRLRHLKGRRRRRSADRLIHRLIALARRTEPARVTWLGANGQVVRSFDPAAGGGPLLGAISGSLGAVRDER